MFRQCWAWIRRQLDADEAPIVELVSEPPGAQLVVWVPFGDAPLRPPNDGAGEWLVVPEPGSPGRIRDIAAFSRRRGLPIDAWFVTGVDALPLRVDETARWLALLAHDVGPTPIQVDVDGLSDRSRSHLAGHLVRLGCSPEPFAPC